MKKIIFFTIIINISFISILFAGAFHEYVYKCEMDSIKQFIENGVDINSKDSVGSYALSIALYEDTCGKVKNSDKKRYDLVKLLIDNGADVNQGTFPAFYDAYNCGTYAVKCYDLFVEKGADLQSKVLNKHYEDDSRSYYLNPLTIIFDRAHHNYKYDIKKNYIKPYIPSIRYLLEKKVDPNLLLEKMSALDVAFEIGELELVKLLKKYNAKKRIDIENIK